MNNEVNNEIKSTAVDSETVTAQEPAEEKQSTFAKIFNVVKSVFVWVVFAIAAFMMVFTLASTMFNKTDKNLLGYKFFIVLSDSMKATHFDAGDIVISKELDDYSVLKEGDVITFISTNPQNYGETVTHMISQRTYDDLGQPGFITKGTTTGIEDDTVVTFGYILGEYQTRIPKMGHFFSFLKSTPGYIVCVLVPFLVLILAQGINVIRLFRRYRAEQLADIKAERAQIDKERAESQKMMEELMALKLQMEAQSGAQAGAAAQSTEQQSSSNGEQNP